MSSLFEDNGSDIDAALSSQIGSLLRAELVSEYTPGMEGFIGTWGRKS
jgi:hypothetical protein